MTATPYSAFPNTFRQSLTARKRLVGCWSSLASASTTEILGMAGFDWLLLDGEHAPNTLQTFIPQLLSLKDSPSAPVVRPPCCEPVIIKQLLDIGFANFLMPWIETREQAQNAVAYTRYPPEGCRGVSVGNRANRFGFVTDYFKQANEQIGVIVQIESLPGVENVEEIAAVDGIDGLFIGPSDLTAAYGAFGQLTHPDVAAAIQKIVDAGKRHHKTLGVLAPNEADAKRFLAMGFNLVAVGSDIGLLRNAATDLSQRFTR